MQLPSSDRYLLAVQNPQNCFTDQEMRKLHIRSTRQGLPWVTSGSFGLVCQFTNGTHQYAVKCFTRSVNDVQLRYEALASHFRALTKRPYSLVDFEYFHQGIRVDGGLYPCVKMEWAQGELLHRYVERNRARPDVLKTCSASFVTLVAELRKVGITHGDLQHGNIVVQNGVLRVIDYDGTYIPSLKANPVTEFGNPNYNHPLRSNGDYGEDMDNFSAFLIYLSILAVSHEPELWTAFHNGENLIFNEDDLSDQNAGTTNLWRHLKNSLDPEVRKLTGLLEHYCHSSWRDVPILEEIVSAPSSSVMMTPLDWQIYSRTLPPSDPRKSGVMTSHDWRQLGNVINPSVQPRNRDRCTRGHLSTDPSEVYCAECAKTDIESEIGERKACPNPKCPAKIPERSLYCRMCGKPTGWNVT